MYRNNITSLQMGGNVKNQTFIKTSHKAVKLTEQQAFLTKRIRRQCLFYRAPINLLSSYRIQSNLQTRGQAKDNIFTICWMKNIESE